MALLHRPSATLRACEEDSAEAPPRGGGAVPLLHLYGSGPGPAMTCTTLRQLLLRACSSGGTRIRRTGGRDATEVLKALLEILRVADPLRVPRRAAHRQEGDREKSIQPHNHPAPEPHGTVWTAHLPSTARTMGQALHLCEEQEVEGRLDDEDMEQMARLHGAPLPTPRYTRRRDTMKLVGVEGDLFFVELGRIYLDRTGRPRRSIVSFTPDSIQFDDHIFHVGSMVCHANHHYTCVLRHGRAWWEYDDRSTGCARRAQATSCAPLSCTCTPGRRARPPAALAGALGCGDPHIGFIFGCIIGCP